VEAIDKELPLLEAERDKLLSKLGNVVDPEVPIGEDEDTHNAVCRLMPHPPGLTLPQPVGSLRYDLPPTKPLKHDELLWRIGGSKTSAGAKSRATGATSSPTRACSSTRCFFRDFKLCQVKFMTGFCFLGSP